MTNLFLNKIIITTAALTGCFFLFSCENDEKQIEALTRKVDMVEEARNIQSYLSQDGKLKAKLTAPLMLRRLGIDTPRIDFPNSLHCDFYDDSTKIESWLDSKYGKYFENLNKVYLWDSVVVINVKGDTLKCQDLWWDQNRKLFYSDKYAEYRTIDKKIYPGKGLEATQDFSRVTFNYPTGTLKVKEDGFPQ
jgi:LPS export ABC transporter protein LptC